ncbi:hypothetical protein [Nocardia sp. CNY236]|uniref:hypothetical protein n=1 Tax=Nocardia sp. CNY236 TaxID=1169152 RepID=UPI00048B7CDD|nr:hypothetical protein [Nocardia sp. CNY236]
MRKIVASGIAVIAAVMLPSTPAAAEGDFGGGGCRGYWHPLEEVNGTLEWGVESHCVGTGWMPHILEVELQKGHHALFFSTVLTEKSPGYTQGSPDISLHYPTSCTDATEATYRMKVYVTAGSHTGNWLSPEYTVPCDV